MNIEEAIYLLNNLKNTINTQEYVNHFEKYDKAIETILNELEKQGKVIDAMAEDLSNLYNDYEPCYIKENMNCKKYKSCIDCIKEYFYKKVEG